MTAPAPLRMLTSSAVAFDVSADPELAARSSVVIGSSLPRAIHAARSDAVDVAIVNSGDAAAALTATVLRGLGVPVWWIDAIGSACPGSGAPALTSPWPDLAGFDRLAELAGRPGAGRRTNEPLSVVVTSLNEGPDLDRVVAAIVAQLGPDDELVVVDGGSSDGSVERASAAFAAEPRVRFVVVAGAGISAGRNIGVRAARHDVIACTDVGCSLAAGWVEGLRRAFAGDDRPGLVSGSYRPTGESALDQAQAYACYPDPREVRRLDLLVRAYTRVFGTGFRPAYAVGRNVAFTRAAWTYAGGFPEHLPTGEDVTFGLAVARRFRCVGTSDSAVAWTQRASLAATWRMYRAYGRASTTGGDVRLLARDSVRGAAYVLAVLSAGSVVGRRATAAGLAAYLTVPVLRARRGRAPARVYPLLPLALATKDLGKLTGAVAGLVSRLRSRA